MRANVKVAALLALIAVLAGSAASCGLNRSQEQDIANVSAVDLLALEELPRGNYEGEECDYLSSIENITSISPLNDSRFLVVSDGSGYGDAATQKLYIADDKDSSVKEVTPDLDLGITAYYSAMGTEDGRIFIAAIEPKYWFGKDPGHDEEENFPQDHIDYIFDKALKVNYKIFEINTEGKVISENKLDIKYDEDKPVSWLICEDYRDNKLIISAVNVDDIDRDTTYYVVDRKGNIKGEIENYIPQYGPTVKKAASNGKMCFVGYDFDTPGQNEKIYLYDKDSCELSETFGFEDDNLGDELRTGSIDAGTTGHGDDLLYLSSSNGLFTYTADNKYENIIDYSGIIPDSFEISSVAVLDNNSVYIAGEGYFRDEDRSKKVVYKFSCNNG